MAMNKKNILNKDGISNYSKKHSPYAQSISDAGDPVLRKFKMLMELGDYREVVWFGDKMKKDEFSRYICQVMTTFEHFQGLFEHLNHRNMIPDLFVHGNMTYVRRVIVELGSHKSSNYEAFRHSLYEAIILSLNESRYDRAANLLEAVQARFTEIDKRRKRAKKSENFADFVQQLVEKIISRCNTVCLKGFLNCRNEFKDKFPTIFEAFCEALIFELEDKLDYSSSQTLLEYLIGQPSLLTLTAFTKGFLDRANDANRRNFIKYAWREAIVEGLKEEYEYGGKHLWNALMIKFVNEFSHEYPPSKETLNIVLNRFKTKQELEQEWFENNGIESRMESASAIL